ncbi:hypothetical protein HDU77_010074 [Chytriomyces hyalinus]|nr:hypothetical protein HDU77_010074 [Chytriomyces hyalinus]
MKRHADATLQLWTCPIIWCPYSIKSATAMTVSDHLKSSHLSQRGRSRHFGPTSSASSAAPGYQVQSAFKQNKRSKTSIYAQNQSIDAFDMRETQQIISDDQQVYLDSNVSHFDSDVSMGSTDISKDVTSVNQSVGGVELVCNSSNSKGDNTRNENNGANFFSPNSERSLLYDLDSSDLLSSDNDRKAASSRAESLDQELEESVTTVSEITPDEEQSTGTSSISELEVTLTSHEIGGQEDDAQEHSNVLLLERIQKLQTYASMYGVDREETSTEYLALIYRTASLWKPAFVSNATLPHHQQRQVLFVHMSMWQDDFGWMGTVSEKKGQTLIVVSAGNRGIRSSPTGLANIPVMLTSSAVVKTGGINAMCGIFSEELQELSRGFQVNVKGIKYLLFPFISSIIGDSPARFRALGLKTSVRNSVPCGQCITPLTEFPSAAADNSLLCRMRKLSDMRSLAVANRGKPGKVLGSTGVVAHLQGYDLVPVTATWPGQNVPESEIVDLMHSEFLGSFQKHLTFLASRIKSPTLYPDLSRAFKAYCHQNQIAAMYDFKDDNSIKGLKANGLKELLLVSPWLLTNMGVINPQDANLCKEFRIYCHRARAISILCMHKFPARMFKELTNLLSVVLHHFGSNHPSMVTYNLHQLHHYTSSIVKYGPLRDHWCFVYAHMIGLFKSCYHNTNNWKASFSVFQRVISTMVIELMNQVIIDAETLSEIEVSELYMHKSGEAVLNWASIKEGDYLLMLLGDKYVVMIFHALVVKRCGDNCDLFLCRHPGCLLKKEKREGGSLQWLEYSTICEEEGEEDELVVASVEDRFARRLKSLNCSYNSVLIVDDVNEMY